MGEPGVLVGEPGVLVGESGVYRGGGGRGGVGGVGGRTLILLRAPLPPVLNRLFTLCGWRGPPRKNCAPTPPTPPPPAFWGGKEGKRFSPPQTHPTRRQGRRTLNPKP